MSQTACVIGCGPAGMAATLALRRAGVMVTCFELAPEPGGLWMMPRHHNPQQYHPAHSSSSSPSFSLPTSSFDADYYSTAHLSSMAIGSGRSQRGLVSPIYPSMQAVLPQEMMAFSDEPFPNTAGAAGGRAGGPRPAARGYRGGGGGKKILN